MRNLNKLNIKNKYVNVANNDFYLKQKLPPVIVLRNCLNKNFFFFFYFVNIFGLVSKGVHKIKNTKIILKNLLSNIHHYLYNFAIIL